MLRTTGLICTAARLIGSPGLGVAASGLQACRRFLSSLPKHRVLNLPALSPTMVNGNLVSWSVKVGDKVEEGDVLANIETDKAVVSFEIMDGGYVAKLLVEQGTKKIPLGTPVCVLVDNAEDVEKFSDYTAPSAEQGQEQSGQEPEKEQQEPEGEQQEPEKEPEKEPEREPEREPEGEPRGEREEAKKGGEDQEKPDAASTPSTVKHSTDPKALSKTTMPHFYMSVLMSCKSMNEAARGNMNINPFSVVVKAASYVLMAIPEVNSRWMETMIRQHNYTCIRVVDVEGQCQHVYKAEKLGLEEISRQLAENDVLPAAPTFTIRQLPEHVSAWAIIDPEQAGVVCLPADRLQSESVVEVTASFDHRVVDGTVGAQWLMKFKRYVECPSYFSE